MPEVEDVVLAHTAGETIAEHTRGLLSQIAIRVLGVVPSKNDLLSVMTRIEDIINIIGIDGEPLLLPGIEHDDIEGYIN